MKISNSKKELARIISENGGWRDGELAAQDGDGSVGGYGSKPEWNSLVKYWWREALGGWFMANKIKNHHQTVLSRAEYFHLYPVPDAKPEFCESVMRTIPEPEAKPTIDQLLQDWRNADDFAKRKQAEADEAAAMRDERWEAVQARACEMGVTVGLCESVAHNNPELVITDWRDLKTGDVVMVVGSSNPDWKSMDGEELMVRVDGDTCEDVLFGHWCMSDNTNWVFIRRP